MAGIRVRSVPKNGKEKHLKIHFSKPEHGGGRIKKIYFPLFNNDAVILFEDPKVKENVLQHQHSIGQHTVEVQGLPEHMVFSTMDAKLDDAASVIVQVTPQLRDEMQYSEGIKLTYEKDQTFRLKGNWFQLEWAWHYIDCFMQQQEVIQHEISQQPQRYAGQPMEVDQSDVQRNVGQTLVDRNSPTEINTALRRHIAERSHLETFLSEGGKNREPQSDQSAGYTDNGVATLSYRDDLRKTHLSGSYRDPKSHYDDDDDDGDLYSSPKSRLHDSKHGLKTEAQASYRDPKLHDDDDVSSSPKSRLHDSKHGLKTDVTDPYDDKYNSRNYSSRSFHHDSDTDEDLHGVGHKVPFTSLQSTISPDERYWRNDDENSTFREFSGLQSMRHVSPDKRYDSGLKADSGRPDSVHDINNTSAESQTLSSSLSKSLSLSPSGKESLGKSGKRSVDAVDHSLSLNKPRFPARATKIPARYTEDQLCKTFDIRGVKVTIYFGDLIQEETDAIVNAANEQLEHYGGIAYAIEKARGPEMVEECRSYIRENGNLKTTGVTHTSGGRDIKSTHIIHAAGPMWLSDIWKDKFTFQLTQTFLNCLEYANKKLWIKSIALPVISSGVYGAPLDLCVRCFLNAVLIFMHKQGDDQRLNDIRLVNNDAESTVTSIVLVETLLDEGVGSLTTVAERFMGKYEKDAGELNLPRGRPERLTDFSRTVVTSTTSKAAYSSTDRPVSEMLSSSRRRSSSLSRISDRKSGPGEVKKHDPVQAKFVPESEAKTNDPRMSGSSDKEKYRGRSGSVNQSRNKDTSPNLRSTISGTTGLKKDSPVQSSKRPSTAEAVRKTFPKMKQTLLPSDKMKSLKTTGSSPKKSESSGLRTSDDYGAFTHGGKSKPSYRLHSDTSEDDEEFGLKSLPADLHNHSYREKFLQTSSRNPEICAICLDDVRDPTMLHCRHKFCSPCISRHFRSSRPSCPTCGALYGKVVGDQPKGGRMTHVTDRTRCLPGYEQEDGMIIITYTFPDGVQEACHPQPGCSYKGVTRKAFLPNSVEGREVLRLLKKAFDNRITFTIGDSKTRGKSGLLTWNDIHHKTSVGGGPTRFGYPDPGYLQRVKDELAAKGITSEK